MSYARHLMSYSFGKGTQAARSLIQNEFNSLIHAGNSFHSLHYLVHSLLSSFIFNQTESNLVEAKMTYLIFLRFICPTDLVLLLYPRMFVLNENPQILPLTSSSFSAGTCFLVHTFSIIYIWVSPNVDNNFLQSAFGISNVSELPSQIPKLGTNLNLIIHQVLSDCWTFSRRYVPVEIIPPGSSKESVFRSILVDDLKDLGADLHNWFSDLLNLRN